VDHQFGATVSDVERLGGCCPNCRIEFVEEVMVIHPRGPIAELDQADAASGGEAWVHVDMWFATAVVRIIEEDEVVFALILVGACAVPKPPILTKQRVMEQRDETQRDNVNYKEERQPARELQIGSSLLNAEGQLT